jgi:TPR repeat protein
VAESANPAGASNGAHDNDDEKTKLTRTEHSAHKGDLKAQLELAHIYHKQKNYPKALSWFSKVENKVSKKSQRADVQFRIGECHQNMEQPSEAALSYEQSYENGSLDGQCAFALCYMKGTGVSTNRNTGWELLEDAASRDHPRALVELGKAHELLGEHTEAWDCYQRVKTHPDGQYAIGRWFESGVDVIPKNVKKAAELYEKAAAAGHSGAQYKLSVCYRTGLGVNKDSVKAAKLLQTAAANGSHQARRRIADDYAEQNDWVTAAELYEKIGLRSLDGHVPLTLGTKYLHGTSGVKQDTKKAIEYLKWAAQSSKEAQFTLATVYENGTGGVQEDLSQAAQIYQNLCYGSPPDKRAEFRLGRLLAHGQGREKDVVEAFRLFTSAAAAGHSGAASALKTYKSNLSDDQKQAIQLFEQADRGSESAQHQLSKWYVHGFNGVPENHVLSSHWYTRALDTHRALKRRMATVADSEAGNVMPAFLPCHPLFVLCVHPRPTPHNCCSHS